MPNTQKYLKEVEEELESPKEGLGRKKCKGDTAEEAE